MQKLVQKQDKKIKLFEQSIKSEYTRKVYTICFKKYLQFPGSGKILEESNPNPRKIEEHIINFVISMKKQGKAFSAIHNYVCAVCKYYKMNDVYINTNKINQYLPEYRKSKKDRAYTHAEIQRLLDIADDRFRAIILLLASTGVRIGAIPDLRLRNIEKVTTESGLAIYKITVYENTNDEYVTFTSHECSLAIDNYLKMRERYGEKLNPNSYLIREQFDVRDPFTIPKGKQVKGNTLTRKLIDLAERSGIRQREVLTEKSTKKRSEIRKDVPIAHGFRKFFSSQLVDAEPDVKPERRWLLEGHNLKANDSHYVRTSDKQLQYEYEKGLDNLTIDPANRLLKKVHKLEIEKTKLEELAQDVAMLKRRIRK